MRRRIVLVSGATTVLVLIAYLVPMLILVRQIAETRAMAAAQDNAQTVATVLLSGPDTGPGTDAARIGADVVNMTSVLRTTVFYPDGTQVGFPAEVDTDIRTASSQGRSFDERYPDGAAVYVVVDLGQERCCVVVRTFVTEAQLQAGVSQASLVLVGLAVALLLTALLVAHLLARSLVQPLLGVADVAHGLHEGDLTRRADLSGPPEISAIGATLNRLATRIDELLQAERETVADLSHRVRTPLTALRLNVESLADPEEAQRLSGDVDEVERSVDQVIEQARRPVSRSLSATCDLVAATRARLEFWSVLAQEQGRSMTVTLPGKPVVVPLPLDQVEAAVDAVVGNVFAHTPAGTAFSVSVPDQPPARLVVEDRGPGLAESAMVERGRSGSGSTGLGLDIARRTGESAGGGIHLGPGAEGRGLRAVVALGPTATSSSA